MKISKNSEFQADFESVEKVVKNASIKSYKQKKSEKGHISIMVLLLTFFVHFFKTFATDSKSVWNSTFFDTHIKFFNKIFFLLLLALFLNFDCTCAGNGSKNRQSFLWMCLRILLGNHQRVCITKLLKLLFPNADWSVWWNISEM